MVVDNGFKVTLRDFGIFLVAVRRGKLVEVRESQSVNYQGDVLVAWVQRLKLLKGSNRFRVLLIKIIGFSKLQLGVDRLRGKRKFLFDSGKLIRRRGIFLIVEQCHPAVENRVRVRVRFRRR